MGELSRRPINEARVKKGIQRLNQTGKILVNPRLTKSEIERDAIALVRTPVGAELILRNGVLDDDARTIKTGRKIVSGENIVMEAFQSIGQKKAAAEKEAAELKEEGKTDEAIQKTAYVYRLRTAMGSLIDDFYSQKDPPKK